MRYLLVVWFILTLNNAYAVVEYSVEINSLQMHEYKILGVGWDRVVKVRYNPANIPEDIFGDDPRLAGLSSGLREEKAHLMVEALIVEHLNQLNAVEGSTFIGVYAGRTNETCEKTSVNIPICWSDAISDTVNGLTTINFVFSASAPERVPKLAKVELTRKRASMRTYTNVSFTMLHEFVHLAGFDHTTEEIDSIMNVTRHNFSTTLYQNDVDGMKELYKVKESCASTVEIQNDAPSFIVQVFYEGQLHKVRFAYHSMDGVEMLKITEFFTPSINTRCTLKLDGDSLQSQFLRYNNQLYWLDVRVTSRGIELTGLGLVN